MEDVTLRRRGQWTETPYGTVHFFPALSHHYRSRVLVTEWVAGTHVTITAALEDVTHDSKLKNENLDMYQAFSKFKRKLEQNYPYHSNLFQNNDVTST